MIGVLFYTTERSGGVDAVVPALAVDLTPSSQFWITNYVTLTDSDMNAYDNPGETGAPIDDYLEYNGLTMLDGSAYTAWSHLYEFSPQSHTTVAYFSTAPFPGNNTLQLTGTDPLTISTDPNNSAYLRVTNSFTQAVEYDGFIASVGQIAVTGVPNLTIDDINGNPIPSGGLSYDGDGGSGTLKVITGNGNSQNDVTNVTASGFSLLGSPVTYQTMHLLDFDVHGGTFTAPATWASLPARYRWTWRAARRWYSAPPSILPP